MKKFVKKLIKKVAYSIFFLAIVAGWFYMYMAAAVQYMDKW